MGGLFAIPFVVPSFVWAVGYIWMALAHCVSKEGRRGQTTKLWWFWSRATRRGCVIIDSTDGVLLLTPPQPLLCSPPHKIRRPTSPDLPVDT
ncbi:unnamed protein product [Vitrella brassicaformis CCMP3155]|uniref:Uncharacterized protein n=1 Tax=Vitrella brassicaformis (strain CCMP3155) TaxID=1169540 RepID=A0A0G4EYH4_VITBC|nr:unnamed protein product [Vitrella brassicaformis CCMP3155]|eukprot:CEM04407.1 unnamed protein product [Vitrella brassicaformis CCMP3155]